jgi:putative hydrolase
MDVVLLGIHPNTDPGLGKASLTQMLLQAIKNNQYIDVIAHLDSPPYEIDYEPVVRELLNCEIVVEINNSKSRPGVACPETTQELIAVCKKLNCPIVVSSDAHALDEVGRDDLVRPLLEKARFPVDLIVNRDAEAAFRFVEGNRRKRQMCEQCTPSDSR